METSHLFLENTLLIFKLSNTFILYYTSIKKTKVLAQATTSPKITINNYELEVVEQFIYLGSIVSNKVSLDRELDRRIGMAASTLARLGTRG